ncbi:MAG: hypothetical protein PVI81_05970 [Anaerolineales bacterium]
MDFSTQEQLEDMDVFQLDDLLETDIKVAQGKSETSKISWLGLIAYWFAEMRWRRKYWLQTRK